jgi:hypothetical protein
VSGFELDEDKDTIMNTRVTTLLFTTACLLLWAPAYEAQSLDLCGCATVPNLQPFDSTNPATFPPGTTDNGTTLTLQLPAGGVFTFSRMNVLNRSLTFSRNDTNSPVIILVAGDVNLSSTIGCCLSTSVSGSSGSGGSSTLAGVGGAGGPGGFRGGDGASLAINGAAIGGAGFGPAGGDAGTASPFTNGGGATFLGVPELTPLIGGSGGGGGSSTSAASTSCSGGGGGGGGGGLMSEANVTFTIQVMQLFADGGSGAGQGNGNCASAGGGGSGGAIRLVANRFVQNGFVNLLARGGNSATDGRIRLESVETSAQTLFNAWPPAQRVVGPTPIANAITPTVVITSVGGSAVPLVPVGTFGAIDVVLSAPGPATIVLATTGVPGGTSVQVTVKPRIGGVATAQTVPLVNCTQAGACDASTTFNLTAGAYVVEARATFQIQ